MPFMTPFGPGGYGNNPQADQWLMQQMMGQMQGGANPFLQSQPFQSAAQLPQMMQPQGPNFGGQMPPNYVNQMGQIGPAPQNPPSPIPQPPVDGGQMTPDGSGALFQGVLGQLRNALKMKKA
jgi:hypothetical protein